MRIHSNTLTTADLYTAARLAKARLQVTSHGSRKRSYAFEVKLTGNSSRYPMGGPNENGDHAATWDQWGIFLGYLYALDNDLATPYSNLSDFDYKTDWRFALNYFPKGFHLDALKARAATDAIQVPFPLDHDHRWLYSDTPFQNECKCGAVRRW